MRLCHSVIYIYMEVCTGWGLGVILVCSIRTLLDPQSPSTVPVAVNGAVAVVVVSALPADSLTLGDPPAAFNTSRSSDGWPPWLYSCMLSASLWEGLPFYCNKKQLQWGTKSNTLYIFALLWWIHLTWEPQEVYRNCIHLPAFYCWWLE